ncbi:Proteasome subunit beta type-7, partial [Thalictrum thalictroides]
DGVILGADTRATEGPLVADKNCEKIHYMAPNIYCCGAGTAADTEAGYLTLIMFCFYPALLFNFSNLKLIVEAAHDLGKNDIDTELVEKVWDSKAPGQSSLFNQPYAIPTLVPPPLLILNCIYFINDLFCSS